MALVASNDQSTKDNNGSHRSPGHHHADRSKGRKNSVAYNQNCSLFITGLPADLDVTRFMAQGANVQIGKVAAIHLHDHSPEHRNKAATVTMWTRASAERFLRLIHTGRFSIGSRPIRAVWNRKGVGPQTKEGSRVVEAIGRSEQVDPDVLIPRFRERFQFELDQVEVKLRGPNWTVVEYRFGSFTDQA
ncbi:hypothetical protein PG985_014000 [Apiospora marii]|uniref:RRM domain-containing protein n=1 Tax=Apiospora marii TaxID=335849 RepID=A0ABR1R685_9PEZI